MAKGKFIIAMQATILVSNKARRQAMVCTDVRGIGAIFRFASPPQLILGAFVTKLRPVNGSGRSYPEV